MTRGGSHEDPSRGAMDDTALDDSAMNEAALDDTGGLVDDDIEVLEAVVAEDLRERYRRQLLDSIGGWSGTIVTAVPPLVFVLGNSFFGLRVAILAALGAAALMATYRVIRKQPLQQALTGLVGVAFAAFIAWRTGEAKSYFLVGIITSFGYAAAFGISILMRRPLVGLLWEFMEPSPVKDRPWYRVPTLLRAYTLATLAGFVLFLSRAVVQQTLFAHDATGWLAAARLGMGYPLYIAVVGFAFWVCRRAHRRVEAELEPAA
jgi:hypothetical protein